MARTYTWRFHVRTYELDQFGHVNNANYLNYLEEGATQASTDAGYSLDWYLENNCFWLVKKMTIRYYQPALYREELELKTWVSDFKRVQSHREYDLRRVHDGERIVRARANWVFVDSDTLQPRRTFPEFEQDFDPHTAPLEDLGVHIRSADHLADTHRYTSYRTAESYEIDRAGHVNNGVYFRWVEFAYNNALNTMGWPLKRQMEELNFAILVAGHEMEYFKPAFEGDRIKITSWVTQVARVRGAWYHEIRNADTDELLARDYGVGAFVDISGSQPRPKRINPRLLDSALTGKPT